jgi:hypothetical protein
MRLSMLLLALTACATISTAGMSDYCRTRYNACLNACPAAARRGEPNPAQPIDNVDLANSGCTATCNDQAKTCK